MTDRIYTFNELIDQPTTELAQIETVNEIVQIVISPDEKEYIVLHNYYNNFLDINTDLKIDNIKIYRDTFIKNTLSNSQIEFKVFPRLYGQDKEKIIARLDACLPNSNIQTQNNDVHLFYVPVNARSIIDPQIDELEKRNTGEIIVKITLPYPGYLFIGKTEEFR